MGFSAKRIAMCGVLLAVSITVLYFASFVPNVESTAMAVAGALVYIVSARFSLGVGAVFYVASVLLALLVVPMKLAILPYIFSFAPYGLLKSPIERLTDGGRGAGSRGGRGDATDAGGTVPGVPRPKGIALNIAGYLLKALAFAATTGAGLLIFGAGFFSGMRMPEFAVPLLVIGALALFLLYDRILSLADAVIGRRIG
ncbi:MAG: hypothetical protein LBL63_01745 [Clostridiales Family XIII bacterium]|jgi:hypothetical protein|nr:hypothetical protein [Clostridiales Family XIII bacterium]